MLLPSKGVSAERALISVGSDILALLEYPTSVSGAWENYKTTLSRRPGRRGRITFDWFSLALAALFTLNAIEWTADGRLQRRHVSS